MPRITIAWVWKQIVAAFQATLSEELDRSEGQNARLLAVFALES
jgi:hypothetical protein